MKKTLLALLFLLFSKIAGQAFIQGALAKDFGVQGATYQIREENFLQEIQAKLREAEKSGKIAKLQSEMKKQTVARANRPKEVLGISKAEESREWIYDPSVSLDHDLRDQNGQVFYKAYTKVNPLDKISLSKALIFIDGDDKEQVNWALQQNKKRKNHAKVILVKGAVIDLMRQTKVRFYFDQNGTLTSRFKISHTPAIVEQEEKILKVREVAI